MSHYHELTSEKYWNDSVQAEIKELQLEKTRQSIRSFIQFLFAIVVFALTVYAVQQSPNWLSAVSALMEQTGIVETFGQWSSK